MDVNNTGTFTYGTGDVVGAWSSLSERFLMNMLENMMLLLLIMLQTFRRMLMH